MYKFAVIGVGGLGSRYIQSLASLKVDAVVFAVDLSDDSLNKSKQLFDSMNPADNVELRLCHNIDELDEEIDIAAIATTSKPRRALTEQLLNGKKVKYLILEKVLFTELADYEAVGNLIKEKNVKTWINCSRRLFPFFKRLKDEFAGRNVRFVLSGGLWGIGCNSIHYIDLIDYITNNSNGIEIYTDKIDNEIISSKRGGCIEFTGTLEGKTDKCDYFALTSSPEKMYVPSYTISAKDKVCVVNESQQKAYLFKAENNWNPEELEVKAYYQSTITSQLFEQIVSTGDCLLPDYETACREHMPFLAAMLDFINKDKEEKVKSCPIT